MVSRATAGVVSRTAVDAWWGLFAAGAQCRVRRRPRGNAKARQAMTCSRASVSAWCWEAIAKQLCCFTTTLPQCRQVCAPALERSMNAHLLTDPASPTASIGAQVKDTSAPAKVKVRNVFWTRAWRSAVLTIV